MKDDIKPYLDKWGYIQPDTSERSCANNRFTSEWYLTIYRSRLLDDYDRLKFERLVELCEIVPGLLSRHPYFWTNDFEAPDDYISVAHAASKIVPKKAEAILQYGRDNKWNYNNIRPLKWNIKTWFGRRQEVIAHFYFCAGKKPNAFRTLYWCLCVFLSAYRSKKDQDGWALSWHLVNAAKGKNKMCDRFIRFWYFKLRQSKPDNIGDILADYFQDKNHPLAKYFVS